MGTMKGGPMFATALALATTALGGCSTLSSVDVSKTDVDKRKGAYLNYSVARSTLTFTISSAAAAQQAAPVAATQQPAATKTAQTAAPAGGGDPSGAAAPAPVEPDLATMDQEVAPPLPGATAGSPATNPAPPPTASQTPAGSKGSTPAGAVGTATASGNANGSGPGSSVDTSRCGVLHAQYAAAQALVADGITRYIALAQRLSAFGVGAQGSADTPKALAADVDGYLELVKAGGAYVAVVTAAGGTSIKGNEVSGVYDDIVKLCPPRVTVDVQQKIVPDNTRTFALRPRTNVFYSDTLTLGVDANGFITHGAPTSASKVVEIASEVAKDVGMAAAPLPTSVLRASSVVKPRLPGSGAGRPGPTCTIGDPQDALADFAVCDPGAKSDATPMKLLAVAVLRLLPAPGSLKNLPETTLPRTVFASMSDFDGAKGVAGGEIGAVAADLRSEFGLDISLLCSTRQGLTPPPDGIVENVVAGRPQVYDGIVVSAPRACRMRAIQKRDGQELVVAQSYLWAQDSRFLTVLPTSRGFLVQRSVDYTFANGQATGVTDSRPSEALAIVSFPGTVIGSFVGGIAAGATNRSAKASARTSELKAQTDWLTAQAAYMEAQAKVKTAKDGATTANSGTTTPN